jgi:hypothetical protein
MAVGNSIVIEPRAWLAFGSSTFYTDQPDWPARLVYLHMHDHPQLLLAPLSVDEHDLFSCSSELAREMASHVQKIGKQFQKRHGCIFGNGRHRENPYEKNHASLH